HATAYLRLDRATRAEKESSPAAASLGQSTAVVRPGGGTCGRRSKRKLTSIRIRTPRSAAARSSVYWICFRRAASVPVCRSAGPRLPVAVRGLRSTTSRSYGLRHAGGDV